MDYHNWVQEWKQQLGTALREDDWLWDWTTRSCLVQDRNVHAQIVSKSAGVWCGNSASKAAEFLAREAGLELKTCDEIEDGQCFEPGQVLTRWEGNASIILGFERAYLNLVSFICGVAWQTYEMKKIIREVELPSPPRLTATRKTLPGLKDLSNLGVVLGGGHIHRLSLQTGVLVKENHIALSGSIARAVQGARDTAPHGLKIEVEVRDLDELKAALDAGADFVLLDNFSPSQVKDAVSVVRDRGTRVGIEVSGGISLKNIREFVIEGVDVLSSGSLTHSVRAVDLSLLIDAR